LFPGHGRSYFPAGLQSAQEAAPLYSLNDQTLDGEVVGAERDRRVGLALAA